jgi:hypothetical protein
MGMSDTIELTAGIYPGMADAAYFAHPALSHSDTKLFMPPRTPAKFRYLKDTDTREFKAEFDFGHVVHELVLGTGAGIDVIDHDDWRTKDAKAARDESRSAGRAPVLRHEYFEALACAEGVRRHPLASRLLDAAEHTELAMIWDDDGLMRKAKLDIVAGRFGVDLKTTENANTERFARAAANYGYFTQDAWYRDGLAACLDIDDPAFLFLVVEKDPPYLVNVIELDPYDVELGRQRNRRATDLYRQCVESGDWAGYGDDVNRAELPRWARMAEEMETEPEEYPSW